ncbi:PP2C family protein-serine/threonine phosphatase [Methylomagnum ishizawai]|uniref:PP2C family protein-serine/threonine phosphatase n=1 Tax=Methylomagnum ishizawai TaxID=1760988 RepID=UPI001C327EBC|nr:PP2C family serine/threonine-protein phosphatase [Methylomagnum ishizawai]BBL73653.1 protein-serine/threonine phosphatase [Methylomagnum ishizawai]
MLKLDLSWFSLPRNSNEESNFDAFGYISIPPDGYLLAIADGVGSARFGKEAAKLAITICSKLGNPVSISELFSEVGLAIKGVAKDVPDQWSTTLSVCWINGAEARVGHVGDTRIYHLRDNGLKTLTRDQTEVAKLLQEGVLTKERAARYPRRNILLSSMNGKCNFDLYQTRFEIRNKDRILLLSDGVYKRVTKREILTLSQQHSNSDTFLASIKNLIIEKGITDDSTALCAEILSI